MTRATAQATPRLSGLDGLRLLAAVAVVAYHYTGIETQYWGAAPREVFPTLNVVTRYGFLGVEFFFIISGFVILMTAYGKSVTLFAASRVARLYPAYWAAIGLTVLLQVFWQDGRNLNVPDALLNLTMVQEAFDVTNAQGAFWSLWIELKFYLLIGAFILVGITRARVIALAAIWPLLARIVDVTNEGLLTSLLVPTYAPYFSLGMMLFLLYRDGNSLIVWLVAALNFILCLHHATAYAPRASELVGESVSPAVVAGLLCAMVAAVWCVSSGPLRGISGRWLGVLGGLTYSLYLIHGQFGFWVIDALAPRSNAYAVLALAVVLAIGLACLIHFAVERVWHDRLRAAVARGLAELGARGEPVRAREQDVSAESVDGVR